MASLLHTSEAARLVGVSAETIRLWVRQGRLKSQQTARGVNLLRPADVFETARERARERGLDVDELASLDDRPRVDEGELV